mmetsp:Transcript_49285/g.128593  ORF Transcript_49285/g.128593 Transcript_49285/m.128593 type:complete len:123 (-) Transcript_49285:329-697(-)
MSRSMTMLGRTPASPETLSAKPKAKPPSPRHEDHRKETWEASDCVVCARGHGHGSRSSPANSSIAVAAMRAPCEFCACRVCLRGARGKPKRFKSSLSLTMHSRDTNQCTRIPCLFIVHLVLL